MAAKRMKLDASGRLVETPSSRTERKIQELEDAARRARDRIARAERDLRIIELKRSALAMATGK